MAAADFELGSREPTRTYSRCSLFTFHSRVFKLRLAGKGLNSLHVYGVHIITLTFLNSQQDRGPWELESRQAFVSAGPHAPDKHFANVPWQRLGDSEMAAEVKGYLSE